MFSSASQEAGLQLKAAGASFMRSPIKKAGKGQKKRGEDWIRGRLVEGVGVRGRANLSGVWPLVWVGQKMGESVGVLPIG